MKKSIKNVYAMLIHRDEEIGICAMDVLKYTLIAAVLIGVLLMLTKWIGFAAAFAVTFLSVAAVAAGICFCIEE